MSLNNPALVLIATTLQTNLAYAQLHSNFAGVNGTDNIATAARGAVTWGVPDSDGDFGLASQIDFTGGTPNGVVYSVTLWDAATGGTFYGECPLTGDGNFNSAGMFSVTAIDVTGAST